MAFTSRSRVDLLGNVAETPADIDAKPQGNIPQVQFAYSRATLIDASKQPGENMRAVEVQLNPNEFMIRAGAEYARLDVPGLSHQVVQWSHTKSKEFEFTLEWDYDVESAWCQRKGLSQVDARFYIWLMSFVEPLEAGCGPAPMQVYWPGFLWIGGVVADVEVRVQRWGSDGVPRTYSSKVSFLEVRREFMHRERFLLGNLAAPENPAFPNEVPQAPDGASRVIDWGGSE